MDNIVNIKSKLMSLYVFLVSILGVFLCNTTFAANELSHSASFMAGLHLVIGKNGENFSIPIVIGFVA